MATDEHAAPGAGKQADGEGGCCLLLKQCNDNAGARGIPDWSLAGRRAIPLSFSFFFFFFCCFWTHFFLAIMIMHMICLQISS